MAYNQQPQPSRVKLPPRNSIQKYRHQVAAQARAMGMSRNLVNHALTSPFTQVLASEDLRPAAPDEGPPSEETILKELRDHLTIAAHLELSTIPIYLYGMYSAKQRKDAEDLLSIVIEEMLHLVLAGNVYVAITPQDAPPLLLYDPSIAERYHYPSLMFDRIPELMLHLRPLDEAFIDMGKQIECRLDPPPDQKQEAHPDDDDHYRSLGEFYEGVIHLIEQGQPSFAPNAGTQINDQEFTFPDGYDLQPILDANAAIRALQTIIEQGEGATPDSPNSHLAKFNAMKPPEGGIWNVPVDPAYQQLDPNTDIAKILDLFDAAFCYLLLSIEKTWQVQPGSTIRNDLVNKNIWGLMESILKPLAKWLVQTPAKAEDPNGPTVGPRFEFYHFETGPGGIPKALNQLQDLTKSISGTGFSGWNKVKSAIDDMASIEGI